MIILIGLSLSVSRKKGCFGSRCEISNPNIEKSNTLQKSDLEKFKDGIKIVYKKKKLESYIPPYEDETYKEIFKAFEKEKQKGIPILKKCLEKSFERLFMTFLYLGNDHFENKELIFDEFFKSEGLDIKTRFDHFYDLCDKEFKKGNFTMFGVWFAKLSMIINYNIWKDYNSSINNINPYY